MTEKEIESSYKNIHRYYEKYLKQHGVKLPALRNPAGKFTKSALVLIRLAQGYPNTKIVSKEELTSFIRAFDPNAADVQQARHLSMQKGWYVESGTRGDSAIPKGAYKLISLEKPSHPEFFAFLIFA